MNIKMYSPIVTAGGGESVKKNFAWSAGPVIKMNIALITARAPANLVLPSQIETSPMMGLIIPLL